MNLLVCLLVIAITGTLVIKKFKAQTVLLLGGLIMMFAAYLLGYTTSFVEAKKSTGVLFFDAFEFINITTAKDAANLGLMIMTCTGFAKYMDHIGASSRLVVTAIKPLGKMKSASLVIPSASGLAMLMMVTIFPILVRLGVSPVGAAAAVATGHLLDIGPASATTLLVSKTVNMPIHEYFVGYQLKVYIICGLMAAIAHFIWQKYMDKKSGHIPTEYVETHKTDELEVGPLAYIFLPLLPLIFILGFSEYGIKGVKMNVNLAMFLSLFIAMGCELIRHRDFRKMAASIQTFFKGMGDQFANTVTLIVAGETFAFGLTSLGIVKEFVAAIQGLAISADVVGVIVSGIIMGLSVVMGSGVASMFAFAPLVPNFAADLGGNATTILLGMQNAASVGRLLSPISAVMIAVAGIANISSFELVKRTSVPVIVTFITSTIAIWIIH